MRKNIQKAIAGAGRLFDFGRCYDSQYLKRYLGTNSRTLDDEALRSDWIRVGQDLRDAISRETAKK